MTFHERESRRPAPRQLQAGRRRTQAERSQLTRLALMQATWQLIEAKGLSGINTPDVASEARVSRGALTHHFSSKDELISRSILHQIKNETIRFSKISLHDLCTNKNLPANIETFIDYIFEIKFLLYIEHSQELNQNAAIMRIVEPEFSNLHNIITEKWSSLPWRPDLNYYDSCHSLQCILAFARGMQFTPREYHSLHNNNEIINTFKKQTIYFILELNT